MSSDREQERLTPESALQQDDVRALGVAKERAEAELLSAQAALKRKTHELEQSLAMMRAAFDATADGIIATNSNGRITSLNEQYLKMFRVDRQLVMGQDHRRVVAHLSAQLEDPTAYRARIDEIYRSSPLETFDELRMRDGRVYERLSRVQLVNEQQVGRVWSFRDVTAHVQAQEQLRTLNQRLGRRVEERTDALRKTEQQFLQLVLGVEDVAIYMIDTSGHVSAWNPGAERIKGYTSDEIIGKHVSIFYTDEDRANGAPEKALAIAASEGKYETEAWRVRKDGTRFWASVLIDVIRDGSGRVLGYAKITRDMTEWRAMQEQLHQAQKMEAIGQLTGGVAHDFNNLLGVVIGNLQLIERSVAENPGLARKVHTAMRAAARGADLTKRLLAFARRQIFDPAVVDLNRQLSGLTDLMQRSLGDSIEVRIVQAHDLWHTRVDAGQFENAILNLAINARDAMPQGGRLTVRTQNVVLDSAFCAAYPQLEPGEYVSISVTDTGCGIEPEVLKRVFEPFFTTKESGKGSGLGLAMVHGFAEQSGGIATIESKMGRGTTVQLLLPRSREAQAEREDTIVSKVAPGGNETILVVEDDEDLRETVVTALSQLGYRALQAPNAAAALRILSGPEKIHLLFTDVMMPGGMLGPALAKRARELRPNIEVLFTTGYAETTVLASTAGLSSSDVINKPYRNEDLAMRIRYVLDREARVA